MSAYYIPGPKELAQSFRQNPTPDLRTGLEKGNGVVREKHGVVPGV